MTGKTHIAAGLALSSPILQNFSVINIIQASVFVIIGSILPDLDKKNTMIRNFFKKPSNILICIFGSILFYIYMSNNNKFTQFIIGDLIAFLIIIILSMKSKHRTFTHSLIGLLCYALVFYSLINTTALIGIVIGYTSHLIADSFTHRGIELLYPSHKKIGIKAKINSSLDCAIALVCDVIFVIVVIVPKIGG